MAYVAPPRGGATRAYFSVPKVGIDDPTEIDPTNTANTVVTANQYKGITEPLLYGIIFYSLYRVITKLKSNQTQ